MNVSMSMSMVSDIPVSDTVLVLPWYLLSRGVVGAESRHPLGDPPSLLDGRRQIRSITEMVANLMTCWLALLQPTSAFVVMPHPSLHHRHRVNALGPRAAIQPGGDLAGGADPKRNAALAALRRSFLATPSVQGNEDEDESEAAQQLGLLLDVPIARWGFNILPHHRSVLNVFQPEVSASPLCLPPSGSLTPTVSPHPWPSIRSCSKLCWRAQSRGCTRT